MNKLMHELRGFRNNNPGNLEKPRPNTFVWDGQIIDKMPMFYLDDKPFQPKEETRFTKFISMDYGIRAPYRILRMYREKHELITIEGIIGRWAPHTENNTDSYIDSVCRALGVKYRYELKKMYYPALFGAIIKHENGFQPIKSSYLRKVFKWAVPEWHK